VPRLQSNEKPRILEVLLFSIATRIHFCYAVKRGSEMSQPANLGRLHSFVGCP
jgi:hypothetical protein